MVGCLFPLATHPNPRLLILLLKFGCELYVVFTHEKDNKNEFGRVYQRCLEAVTAEDY